MRSTRIWTGIMEIFIIYDTDRQVWPEAYTSFEAALAVIRNLIEELNEAYKASEDYAVEPLLPGGMDDYDKKDVKLGILVANMHDYDNQIFIKQLSVV
jgi:hypothetical protein